MDGVYSDAIVYLALGAIAATFIALGLVVVVVVVAETAGAIFALLRRDRLLDGAPYEELLLLRAAGGGGGDDDGETNRCVICQAAYEAGERCLLLPACKHMFHRACVVAWLSRRATCPLCRAKVDDDEVPEPRERLEDAAAWNMV